jgi:hypothetical protein
VDEFAAMSLAILALPSGREGAANSWLRPTQFIQMEVMTQQVLEFRSEFLFGE